MSRWRRKIIKKHTRRADHQAVPFSHPGEDV